MNLEEKGNIKWMASPKGEQSGVGEEREDLTPLMRQYFKKKEESGDAILLFQVGDFFETFGEDAKIVSRELGIVLTARSRGEEKMPMAGFPCHSAMNYIKRLINRGYKVAICEQVEKPSPKKKVVRREITRTITPGTVLEDELLDVTNNFFMGVFGEKIDESTKKSEKYGVTFIDISTGEMFITETDRENLLSEILKFSPVECLMPRGFDEELKKEIGVYCFINEVEEEFFDEVDADLELKRLHIDINSALSKRVVGATLKYLRKICRRDISHVRVKRYEPQEFMMIDATSFKNLEIFESLRMRGEEGTLLSVLDRTATPMGRRKLRAWLRKPLKDVSQINERLDAVEELFANTFLRHELMERLQRFYDIERLASRIELALANARDLLALRQSLEAVSEVKELLNSCKRGKLREISKELDDVSEAKEIIKRAIVEDPPALLKEGGIIKEGFDAELDALRNAKREEEAWIREFERKERERTGINSLKVGYNEIIGYYIEVTKPNLRHVPAEYRRKQTLKNVERFTVEELERRSERILSAEERIKALEYDIFCRVREEIAKYTRRIQKTANAIAELDVLASFAEVSAINGYVRPEVHEGEDVEIEEGRHPVVELSVDFVPNDVKINSRERFLIITGPNASGKSTYVRMVALIAIMAQIGCFVPAKAAKICVFDRILTRIGSVDEISSGISSFMVEIMEMLKIIRNATERSLVLLDEVGKGTSTYDGISIAWAFSKYMCGVGCKVLFATHFHELTELEREVEGVVNYHFDAVEGGSDGEGEGSGALKFVRKLKRGRATKSYGIKVAEMLNMPEVIIKEAEKKLKELERRAKEAEEAEERGKDVVEAEKRNGEGSEVATCEVAKRSALSVRVKRENRQVLIEELIGQLEKLYEKWRSETVLRAIRELRMLIIERNAEFKLRRKCGESIEHFITKNVLFNSLKNVRSYFVEGKRSIISRYGYRPDVIALTDEELVIIEAERSLKGLKRKLKSLENALENLRRHGFADAGVVGESAVNAGKDPILKFLRAGKFKLMVGVPSARVKREDVVELKEKCSKLHLKLEIYKVKEGGEIEKI
ncbi:MAG: DNA mismatch repair protein MutS [Candidatus Methanospirare jalkutatii]|nr:DNA mismatch repair protein MutS [Candidatus Methanospirare jalkutatii]